MRPISLKIEGFTSFKNETNIDFSRLEVFAITGDNGAGKSSILEAILFALYGKTHRLGKEKKDLVSLGSDKAAVLFEFSSGENRYRVTRSFKQKGNPFMKLEIQKGESWNTIAEQAQVNEEVERILRLPFDAFTKAVMIPQGHFDALLKPREPRERRKTLIDLFDLGIYDRMKTRANEVAREAEIEESQILQQFQSRYVDATPDKRKEVAREKKALAAESKRLVKERDSLMKQHERVREVLSLKKDHAAATSRLDEMQKALSDCGAKLAVVSETVEKSRALELEQVPILEQELQELSGIAEKVQSIAVKEAAFKEVEAAAKSAVVAEQKFQAQLKDLEKKRNAVQLRIRDVKAQLERHGFDEAQYLLLESLLSDLIELRSWAEDRAALQLRLRKESPAVEVLRKEVEQFAGKIRELERQHESARKAAEAARRDSEVLDLKLHLHKGDDCPVCGTRLQDTVDVPKNRMREIQNLSEKAQKKCASLEKELKELRDAGAKKTAEHHWRDQSLQEEMKQLAELNARIEAANTKYARQLQVEPSIAVHEYGLKRYEEQKALSASHRALQAELRDKENECTEFEKQIQEMSAAVTIAASEKERREAERERAAAEMADLRGSIVSIAGPGFKDVLPEELLAALRELRSQSAKRVESLRAASRNAELSFARLQQDESHAKKVLQQEQGTMDGLQKRMQALSSAELDYSELFAETVRAQMQSASAESSRVDHRLGEVSQQLEQIDRLLEEVKEQRQKLESARKRKDVYTILFKHLAGNQLQDYVVSALLQQLMESANHFLKDLTQGRYLLDLEKDNFVVQDSWASGQSRIVDTLSGGESFVVSLALALALSDFMKGGASLESLFIDEGFGSLHRDKLDLVYEALGALSGAGKVIGLVTHIEELAARFPARLHVSNTPSGSEVHLEQTESEW